MTRTRIKICGLTRPEDAIDAVNAGADAIGLVFWQPSPRAVTIEQARAVCAVIPALVSTVALTVNASADELAEIRSSLPIDLFQFHGDETPEQCEQAGVSYIKALRMKPGLDLLVETERFSGARSLLLDAYRKGVPGGTGERFDWELIPEQIRANIILAGGLNAENAALAVSTVKPFAVDVSGGVEQSVGIKDAQKISDFIQSVRAADQSS